MPLVYGSALENWANVVWPSHHLKYSHQQKTKEQGMVVVKIYIKLFSIGKNFWRFGHPPLPATEGRYLYKWRGFFFLINVNIRRVMSTLFSEFSYLCCFLKIISLKWSLCQKAYFRVTNPLLSSLLPLLLLFFLPFLPHCFLIEGDLYDRLSNVYFIYI